MMPTTTTMAWSLWIRAENIWRTETDSCRSARFSRTKATQTSSATTNTAATPAAKREKPSRSLPPSRTTSSIVRMVGTA